MVQSKKITLKKSKNIPAKNTATGSQWIMKLSFEGPYYNSEDCFPTAAGSRHAQTYPSLDTHM